MPDHSHNHHIIDTKNSKLLLVAFFITLCFMVIELIAGIIGESLTLIADSGHMFADSFAILLSWFAINISKKPKDDARTFGYHRFQVIATFINGMSLLVLSIWIIYQAIYRIYVPDNTDGSILFYVGIIGFGINCISLIILRQGSVDDMNIKSAMIQVLSDLLGSLAAIIAGIIIIFTGFTIADPILSLFVSVLLLNATWRLISESCHILMEGSPKCLDMDIIKNEVSSIKEVKDIHHIHIWSLKHNKHYITFHIKIDKISETHIILKKIKDILRDKFGIAHSTIQVEHRECCDGEC